MTGLQEVAYSRFHRLGAPSPRDLLAAARLVLVARLLAREIRRGDRWVATIAYWCGFSGVSALHRHVRTMRGLSIYELDAAAELTRFRHLLTTRAFPTFPLSGTRAGVAV